MIKVNLLPLRKPKRAADPASKQLALGVGAIAIAAAAVFVLVDRPRRSHAAEITASNEVLQGEINEKNKKLVGYKEMQAAAENDGKRAAAIDKLLAAKVIPAHVMQELANLMTPGKKPAMSAATAKLVSTDANKAFDDTWDPHHVWITSYIDNAGAFTLEGGAQSEGDVNQFAKRMAASVYFDNVTPARGEQAVDAATSINYYKFTITGKVAY